MKYEIREGSGFSALITFFLDLASFSQGNLTSPEKIYFTFLIKRWIKTENSPPNSIFIISVNKLHINVANSSGTEKLVLLCL